MKINAIENKIGCRKWIVLWTILVQAHTIGGRIGASSLTSLLFPDDFEWRAQGPGLEWWADK